MATIAPDEPIPLPIKGVSVTMVEFEVHDLGPKYKSELANFEALCVEKLHWNVNRIFLKHDDYLNWHEPIKNAFNKAKDELRSGKYGLGILYVSAHGEFREHCPDDPGYDTKQLTLS